MWHSCAFFRCHGDPLCRYECKDAEVPFSTLLPFTFDKFSVPQEKNVSYCLTRQWGKTAFMRVSGL